MKGRKRQIMYNEGLKREWLSTRCEVTQKLMTPVLEKIGNYETEINRDISDIVRIKQIYDCISDLHIGKLSYLKFILTELKNYCLYYDKEYSPLTKIKNEDLSAMIDPDDIFITSDEFHSMIDNIEYSYADDDVKFMDKVFMELCWYGAWDKNLMLIATLRTKNIHDNTIDLTDYDGNIVRTIEVPQYVIDDCMYLANADELYATRGDKTVVRSIEKPYPDSVFSIFTGSKTGDAATYYTRFSATWRTNRVRSIKKNYNFDYSIKTIAISGMIDEIMNNEKGELTNAIVEKYNNKYNVISNLALIVSMVNIARNIKSQECECI